MRRWVSGFLEVIAALRFNTKAGGVQMNLPAGEGAGESILISVVVPTYNRSAMLREALQSLLDQKLGAGLATEIIVVDNASTDSTPETVEDLARSYPDTRLHYVFEEQQGQAFALNRGIAEARGDWIAFFDDDQLAPASWLAELWKVSKEQGAEITGGPVELHLDEEQLSRVDPICRGTLRELHSYADVHPYDGDLHPAGGNVLIAAQLFARLGNFDTDRSRGYFDVDFFIRARRAGVSMWYAPRGAIWHRIPQERLEPAYFRWDALRTGENLASSDHQYRGGVKVAQLAIARVGQLLLVNLPLYLFALLMGKAPAALGRRTLMWRCEGYVRRSLSLLAPGFFAQRDFFRSMEFRNGRAMERELASRIESRASSSQSVRSKGD